MKSPRLPLEYSLIIVFSSTLVDSSASTPSQRQNFDLLKGCKWWETKREGES